MHQRVDSGGFDNFDASTRTFATKSASYHALVVNACCFAPGNVSVDVVGAEREAREMRTCGRSLCLVKGWRTGLRRKYALREGTGTGTVGKGVRW